MTEQQRHQLTADGGALAEAERRQHEKSREHLLRGSEGGGLDGDGLLEHGAGGAGEEEPEPLLHRPVRPQRWQVELKRAEKLEKRIFATRLPIPL